ncbi:hypothetical protein OIU76_008170 [Salix suchowensis]|nr:hypothetical protein OIU76_008170 [Salix suchowensis]
MSVLPSYGPVAGNRCTQGGSSLLAPSPFWSWLDSCGRDIVDWDATIFIYYTEWTFMLIMIYFALGTVMSAYGCWVSFKQPAVSEHGEKSVFLKRDEEEDGTATSITYKEKKSEGTIKLGIHCAEEAIRERAGFWGYLMQIIYQTCAGAVILTDIIFWCVIVPFLSNSHLGLNALMGCMHSLNAVFLLIDTALNSLVSIALLEVEFLLCDFTWILWHQFTSKPSLHFLLHWKKFHDSL